MLQFQNKPMLFITFGLSQYLFMNPEIIGYIASFLVAISFLFRDLLTIRWVNLVGCIFFVVYGYYIDSIPVMLTNVFIVLVQCYYLFLAPALNKK